MKAAAALAVLGALAPGCRGRRAAAARDAGPTAAAADAAAASAPWVAPMAVLDDVAIELSGAADGAIVSRELGRQLARCLIERGDDVVALDRQADPARRVRHTRLLVGLGAEPRATSDTPTIMVAFAAKLVWTDDDELPAPSVNLFGEASILDGKTGAAVFAVTDQLREEACRLLALQLESLGADDLTAVLADADPEVVAWGLQVIAARKPPGVLDAVIPLLDRPAPVGEAAITALVALGDRRAVTALTDRIDLGDRTRLTTIIEATVALGGADAEDFLRVLTAHADPEVARHAREGLARLARAQSPSQ